MNLERLRSICLGFPGATERIQWGCDLVFKIGGKMFAVAPTELDVPTRLSFKCSDESFSELIEIEGILPAPYLARAKWVALERFDALSDREIAERLREAYDLVLAKLPKKARAAIGVEPTPARRLHGTAIARSATSRAPRRSGPR